MNPNNKNIIDEDVEVNEKVVETKVEVNEQLIDDTLEFLDQIEKAEAKETVVETKIEEKEEILEFTIENAEPTNDEAPLPEQDSIDSIDLDEKTPEEHEKTQDEIYAEEFKDVLNADVNLDELTPEENEKLDAKFEELQDEIELEEFEKGLDEEINLDDLKTKENAKLIEKLKQAKEPVEEDAAPDLIEEAETRPVTPNTTIIEDEAPLPNQEPIELIPDENNELNAEIEKLQDEIYTEEFKDVLNTEVNLDELTPEENNELNAEFEKLQDEIYAEEFKDVLNTEVNLDELTPEENIKLDAEIEKLQNEIELEELEKGLDETVNLDDLNTKENAKLIEKLKQAKEPVEEDTAPDLIEEAETRPVTPNTTIIEDEAPLPNQEDILPQTKKEEKLVIAVEGVTDFMPNTDTELKEIATEKTETVVKEEPKPLSEVDKSLNEVSKASGLNLKAYFIEDNKKEIENLKASGKVQTFEFNGDLKSFYRDAYRYVLESNMIARQLNPDNKHLPDLGKLTEKFEAFMKNVGQELKDRNQIEEYVPFGGLSAHEIRQIQKDVLLNRPQTREEALQRNASKLGGKNYEEKIDNAYELAHNTIEANFGKDYKVGENPKLDQMKLQNTIDTINGAKAIHENQKIWDPYKPKFGLPNFNKPIWRHPISNAFKLIGQGIKIALDCTIVFPITNVAKAITYPLAKFGSSISRDYNVNKLEKELMAKGFTKDQIREKMLENNSKTLDIEKDSKNIDKQFEKNLKTIKEYKEEKEKEKQNKVEKTNVKDVEIQKQENLEINPNKQQIVVVEAETKLYDGDITPKIEDKQIVKTNDLKI